MTTRARAILNAMLNTTNVPITAKLDSMWQRGDLQVSHIDAVAAKIAKFHIDAEVTAEESAWGNPVSVYQPLADNLAHWLERLAGVPDQSIGFLTQWAATEYQRLELTWQSRKRAGFVRHCHGDLRLCNLAWLNDEIIFVDSDSTQVPWIDVINDIAALLVDLDSRYAQPWSARVLNAYLEHSGNYGGLAVLRFYQVYRALEQMRLTLPGPHDSPMREPSNDLALAKRYAQPLSPPFLMITYGVSGAGKSRLTQELLETLGVIRLRSDVERKRLFNLDPLDRTVSHGLYSLEASQMVFQGLEALAKRILRAGFSLIIDATFLQRAHRASFRRLANSLSVPFVILECRASESVLYERVLRRQQAHNDPSDADIDVLKRQLANQQPLGLDEQARVVTVNTDQALDISQLLTKIQKIIFSCTGTKSA